jgi:homoserine dehydrogenase
MPPADTTLATPVTVRLGLLGCGTVGAALVELIAAQADAIAARTGITLRIERIAVRDLTKDRGLDLAPEVFTTDVDSVIENVDVVVELMGGIEPAATLIRRALDAATPVVTANKALLAQHGSELFEAADRSKADLLFEAAVAGGIPIVRPMRESLLGEPVQRILGIVNGTTNFILTRMAEEGATYDDALAEATALGYAEADPTADVGGFDAGAKIAILAAIAFGAHVTADDVYHEGIERITAADVAYAADTGRVIKLVAVAESDESGIALRVHPVLLPLTHPLAAVRDSFNAVFVEGDAVGELMFYGRGAGGNPTASAVLGDIIDAGLNTLRGTHASMGTFTNVVVRSIDELACPFYITLEVLDRPGVLAAVAGAFGDRNVSIASMTQDGLGDEARIALVTHVAREADVRATLADLRELGPVRHVGSVIRLLDAEDTR